MSNSGSQARLVAKTYRYTANHLNQESAWKIAYFRGVCSARLAETDMKLASSTGIRGSMMSVGLSEDDTRDKLGLFAAEAKAFGIAIACINSPTNVTVSGEEPLVDRLRAKLEEEKIFARKLRVPLAYHSKQMEAIAAEYGNLLGSLQKPSNQGIQQSGQGAIPMLSSVTGERSPGHIFSDPEYWVRNMISPVRFSEALAAMCTPEPAQITKKIDLSHLNVPVVDHLLEIGPHAALQGPVRDILATCPARTKRPAVTYSSALKRGQDAAQTLLNTLGMLFCKGIPVNLRRVNEPSANGAELPSRSLLTNLPQYPFDHSRRYWHESRLSRNYTLRSEPPCEFLGATTKTSKMQWRNFLRRAESSWIDHHVVDGRVVYPAAGMMVMAIEAARQVVSRTSELTAAGYSLSDVMFENPIDLSTHDGVEVQTSLDAVSMNNDDVRTFNFRIESYGEDDEPRTSCRGTISVDLLPTAGEQSWEHSLATGERQKIARDMLSQAAECHEPVDDKHMNRFLEHIGYGYGPTFRRAAKQRCTKQPKRAAASLSRFPSNSSSPVVHPATLDSIVQLCFTCLSSGGTSAMALGIPSRLGSLWISALGLSGAITATETTNDLQGVVTMMKSRFRAHHYNGAIVRAQGVADLMLCYEDFEFTDITSAFDPKSMGQPEIPNEEQYCMKISTKVAVEKLTPDERVDLLMSAQPEPPDVSKLHRDLEILAILSLEDLIQSIDARRIMEKEEWVKRYWSWAEYHLSRFRQEPGWEDPESEFGRARGAMPALRDRLFKAGDISKAYTAVSENLQNMIEGEIAPLELLMPSGLLDGFYAEGNTYRSPRLASEYISLIAHQKPGLRILEVGGGTASTTKILIPQLSDGGSGPGALRCAHYDFTDISSGFLENARNYFDEFGSKMAFGTLNIENDPVCQGYSAESYDIIIADNVLHATLDLTQTMRNVRKLLKPGGKVFMHEWFRADGWSTGFIFGLLSGWWLGANAGRDMSPNVSIQDWHDILRDAGFTGVEEVLRDFDEDGSYDQAYLVTTAVETTPDSHVETAEKPTITFLTGSELASEAQQSLLDAFKPSGSELGSVKHLEQLTNTFAKGENKKSRDIVICLADYGSSKSMLSNMDESAWRHLQDLVKASRRILWVSSGGGIAPHPSQAMITGLARTLRLENYDLQFVTLALEEVISDSGLAKANRHLTGVAEELLALKPYENYEEEYVEINGRLHSMRLIEAKHTESILNEKLLPTKITSLPLGQTSFKVSDRGDGAHFLEDYPVTHDLKHGELIIEVEAASIEADETARSLGWLREGDPTPAVYGNYCAGVVIAAGPPTVDGIGPETRVLALWRGPLRSRIRLHSRFVEKLNAEVPFATACAAASYRATAYDTMHSLVGLRSHYAILVHGAMSPMGEAIASLVVINRIQDLWITVASQEDALIATEIFGVPRARILPQAWFGSYSGLTSNWNAKFDLVVDTLSDPQALPRSMKYLRSGGCYVSVRPLGSNRKEYHYTESFQDNMSFHKVIEGSQLPSRSARAYAAAGVARSPQAASNGRKGAVGGAKVFSVADINLAVSHKAESSEKDTTVVEFTKSEIIEVSAHALNNYPASASITDSDIG